MNKLLRSYWYVLSILLPVLVVILVGGHTWRELRQLHRNFSGVQAEDLYIPAHIEVTIQKLNQLALRTALFQSASDRAAFESIGQDLQQYIAENDGRLSESDQEQLLTRTQQAFEAYLSRSQELLNKTSRAGEPVGAGQILSQIESNSTTALNLCELLKQSERTEQSKFLHNSQSALSWIQLLLIIVFLVVIMLIATAAVALFRGVVGPLRVELNRSRELAVRNEKLAALGTLSAGVAHEIRNPLTAINVRLHSLKKNLAQRSSELEDALVIGSEIQRLECIVQEFLQFARPAEPKFVVVSTDSLLNKVQTLFQTQLARFNIELQTKASPDIWVRADPRQMEQVLINLIKNSAESIGQTGNITLRVRTEHSRLAGQTQPVVVIEIIDTGKGIPLEIQQHMFDPFFTTKETGTGLGLVIASRIVEKHHGVLECQSALNRGTTFAIRLPRVTSQAKNELQT